MSLHVRLSLYWFFMTGAMGVFFPYLTLYLKENVGLSGREVGMVFAVTPLVGMVAPTFWGQIADRTGARTRTLAFVGLGASAGYLGITLPDDFPTMLVAMVCLAAFSTAVMPMAVAVSLAGLLGNAPAFGRVRVWGTLGFLCATVATPPLLRAVRPMRDAGAAQATAVDGAEPSLFLIFPLASLLALIAAFIAWSLPRTETLSLRAERGAYRALLRHAPYVRLLLFAFGSYLFLQGPIALFPLYVRSRGGDMSTLSYMWIWMIVLEIPLVAYAGRIFERVGARTLVALGTAAGGVRWIACSFTQDLALVYPLQLLHALVVTGLLVGGALYAERLAPERLRSTGQAGLVALGWGLGGIFSNTLGGWLLDAYGIDSVYAVGGFGGLAVALAAHWLLPQAPPTAPRIIC